MKAFIVNRVGDFGFLLGMFALFFVTDSLLFDDVFAAGPMLAETQLSFLWRDWNAANLIGVLLFIGAMGKSRSCSCTPGCPTRWKARHRCRR